LKKKRLHTIGVRVDDELLAKLRVMAEAEMRPVSSQLLFLALEAIAAREIAQFSRPLRHAPVFAGLGMKRGSEEAPPRCALVETMITVSESSARLTLQHYPARRPL
jgi:hypothetical protein